MLRGAKDSSPILNRQQLLTSGSTSGNAYQNTSTAAAGSASTTSTTPMTLIGLQYFDEIEAAGVADAAGIKRGDYLLAVNDVDVRHMSHENAVQLIRRSGDKVTMTIATHVAKPLVSILKKKGGGKAKASATEQMSSSQSVMTAMSQSAIYGSFGSGKGSSSKAPPPAPPKRDPSTTLTATASRARARSLVVPSEVRTAHSLMSSDEGQRSSREAGGDVYPLEGVDATTAAAVAARCASPSSSVDSMLRSGGRGHLQAASSPSRGAAAENGSKVASIRAHSSRRISSYELNDFMSRQSSEGKTAKVSRFFNLDLFL